MISIWVVHIEFPNLKSKVFENPEHLGATTIPQTQSSSSDLEQRVFPRAQSADGLKVLYKITFILRQVCAVCIRYI